MIACRVCLYGTRCTYCSAQTLTIDPSLRSLSCQVSVEFIARVGRWTLNRNQSNGRSPLKPRRRATFDVQGRAGPVGSEHPARASYEYVLEYSKQRRQFDLRVPGYPMDTCRDADQIGCSSTVDLSGGGDGAEDRSACSSQDIDHQGFHRNGGQGNLRRCVQMLGANGYTKEYPIVHRYAEVRGGSIYGGPCRSMRT